MTEKQDRRCDLCLSAPDEGAYWCGACIDEHGLDGCQTLSTSTSALSLKWLSIQIFMPRQHSKEQKNMTGQPDAE